jgi:hypothetical protein
MVTKGLMTIVALISCVVHSQVADDSVREKDIAEIIKALPTDSQLRRDLMRGARGDGVRYPWMDEMQRQNIKRAIVWLDIDFYNDGRPRTITVGKTQYFKDYEGGEPTSNVKHLDAIASSNLQKDLATVALKRAQRGMWVDVPRPVPRPFVGQAEVEFFDDEWLPFSTPMYYAGRTH